MNVASTLHGCYPCRPETMVPMRSCALAILLLLTAPVTAGAESLPGQLPDDAFWRMIVDFSEPSGSFSSENLLSNELYLQHVIPTLKATIKPGF